MAQKITIPQPNTTFISPINEYLLFLKPTDIDNVKQIILQMGKLLGALE